MLVSNLTGSVTPPKIWVRALEGKAGGHACAPIRRRQKRGAKEREQKRGGKGKGDRPRGTAALISSSGEPEALAYAAVFTFSAATATRFDSGCAASLASLISASVFFDASATYESNAPRK